MADNKVTVEFEVVSNAAKKLDEIGKSLEGLQSTADGGFKKASSSFKIFEGVLTAELALRAIDALVSAAGKLFDVFVVEGVKAAQEQQEALNNLNQALAATGEFSEQASKDLQDYAAAVQNSTTVSDEAVLSTAALIQQIARLSGEELKQATSAALDLSAALGIDLDSASRLVAKAAEGNVEAFKRYGVEIQKGTTDTETFANTIEALSRFQGAAESKTRTFAGANKQLSNTFNELQEAVGNSIVENEVVIAVLNAANTIFKQVVVSIDANKDSIKAFVAEGVLLAIDALQLLLVPLRLIELQLKGFKADVKIAGTALGGLAAAITSTFEGGFGRGLAVLKDVGAEIKGTFTQALVDANTSGLQPLADALNSVETAAKDAFSEMSSGATNTVVPINNATKATAKLTDEQKRLVTALQDTQNKRNSLNIDEQLKKELEAVSAAEKTKFITKKEGQDLRFEAELEAFDKELSANDKLVTDLLAQQQVLRDEEAFLRNGANDLEIADNQKKLDTLLLSETVSSDSRIKIRRAELEEKKRLDGEERKFINSFIGFQQSKIGAVAAIGKAAAIYNITLATKQATADAFAGALKFFGFLGPFAIAPAIAVAGAAAAFGAEQIAGVLGAQLAGGIDSVPGTGSRDNFPAVLAPGERVVPTKTNQDLTAFLENQGGQGVLLQAIVDRLDRLQNQIIVNVGGREIVNELRDASLSGRTIEAA